MATDNKVVKTFLDATALTALTAGIGWSGKKVFDWIALQDQLKHQAAQDLTDTDYAFKLYNKTRTQQHQLTMPKEPKFSDYYTPREEQKEGELAFVGLLALGLGYAALGLL